MRLYNHLNERIENSEEIYSILRKECSPIIKEYQNANAVLYRGIPNTKNSS